MTHFYFIQFEHFAIELGVNQIQFKKWKSFFYTAKYKEKEEEKKMILLNIIHFYLFWNTFGFENNKQSNHFKKAFLKSQKKASESVKRLLFTNFRDYNLNTIICKS